MKNDKGLSELVKQIQELEAAKTEAVQMFEAKRNERLAQLHEELGFNTKDELVEALINQGATPQVTKRAAGKAGKASKGTTFPKRGRGGAISQETKDAVVADVKSGKYTSAEIARRHDISVPSVQNIKRDNNLVRSRSA